MMLKGIIIVTVVLNIFLLLKVIFLKMQMRHMSRHLEKIINKETKEILKVSLSDSDIEQLAKIMNQCIRSCDTACNEAERHELMLKQRMSDISHDIRTPLASINGYIQLMESEAVTEEQRHKYLQIVKDKSARMNRLVNSFFEMAVIDSEKHVIDKKEVDLTGLVNEAVLNFYSIMTEKGIEPVIDIESKAINIISDQMSCERIIQNLINNAVNYTIGTVYIGLKILESGKPMFYVKNESEDLTDEIDNIFERFYMVEKSRTSGHSGLGLYIVKVLSQRIQVEVNARYEDGFFTMEVYF